MSDEIVEAERRGYERAMKQISERGSNIGADWDGLSEEIEILLRKAAGDTFLKDREQEQLENDVEAALNGMRRPFFDKVVHYAAELLEGDNPGHAVGHIEYECREYDLKYRQLMERLHPTTELKKFALFEKPLPALPKAIYDDVCTLLAHVDHAGFDAITRIRALLVKLNSFGELKY